MRSKPVVIAFVLLCAVLLLLPVTWGIPIGEFYGAELCLWEGAVFSLTFFVYYLGFGWFVSRGQAWLTGKPNESFLGILLYLNLPITLVYLLRHVDWSEPFTCLGL